MVQGHVDGTGRIAATTKEKNALLVRFTAPKKLLRYIVEKGFIAIDGVSLTVVGTDATGFTVTLIPFTRKHTVLGAKKPGDTVNLEIDIMAKYAERLARKG
jgi:riboflavin synthase